MVKGCGVNLTGVESGWVYRGELKQNFPEGFWNARSTAHIKCGQPNYYVPSGDPNDDMLLCRECLVEGGYIW